MFNCVMKAITHNEKSTKPVLKTKRESKKKQEKKWLRVLGQLLHCDLNIHSLVVLCFC